MKSSNKSKEELIKQWLREGTVKNPKLIQAFRELEREEFIDGKLKEEAYGDYPLPIGEGQTISQPSTIMIMIEALELKETDEVFEVGTGSGYNAALVAKLAKKVYTSEIIPELAEFARKNLEKAGIKNFEVVEGDGGGGMPGKKFDKIIITASCPEIPKPLIEQLKENGIIIAPVGPEYGQRMIKAKKIKGKLVEKDLGSFMFVPLRGKYGQ